MFERVRRVWFEFSVIFAMVVFSTSKPIADVSLVYLACVIPSAVCAVVGVYLGWRSLNVAYDPEEKESDLERISNQTLVRNKDFGRKSNHDRLYYGQHIMPFGRYKGKTLNEIRACSEGSQYLVSLSGWVHLRDPRLTSLMYVVSDIRYDNRLHLPTLELGSEQDYY